MKRSTASDRQIMGHSNSWVNVKQNGLQPREASVASLE